MFYARIDAADDGSDDGGVGGGAGCRPNSIVRSAHVHCKNSFDKI